MFERLLGLDIFYEFIYHYDVGEKICFNSLFIYLFYIWNKKFTLKYVKPFRLVLCCPETPWMLNNQTIFNCILFCKKKKKNSFKYCRVKISFHNKWQNTLRVAQKKVRLSYCTEIQHIKKMTICLWRYSQQNIVC